MMKNLVYHAVVYCPVLSKLVHLVQPETGNCSEVVTKMEKCPHSNSSCPFFQVAEKGKPSFFVNDTFV